METLNDYYYSMAYDYGKDYSQCVVISIIYGMPFTYFPRHDLWFLARLGFFLVLHFLTTDTIMCVHSYYLIYSVDTTYYLNSQRSYGRRRWVICAASMISFLLATMNIASTLYTTFFRIRHVFDILVYEPPPQIIATTLPIAVTLTIVCFFSSHPSPFQLICFGHSKSTRTLSLYGEHGSFFLKKDGWWLGQSHFLWHSSVRFAYINLTCY